MSAVRPTGSCESQHTLTTSTCRNKRGVRAVAKASDGIFMASKPSFYVQSYGNTLGQRKGLILHVKEEQKIPLRGPKSLTSFKLYATSANIVVVPCKRTQQVTTLLGPTMLGPFAWAFCCFTWSYLFNKTSYKFFNENL